MLPDEYELAMWCNSQPKLAIDTYVERTKTNTGAAAAAFQMAGLGSRGIFDNTWNHRPAQA